jgi:hypothetical protein
MEMSFEDETNQDNEIVFDFLSLATGNYSEADDNCIMVDTGAVNADYPFHKDLICRNCSHAIFVDTNDSDKLPHFHVIKYIRDVDSNVTSIRGTRVRIDKAEYYSSDDYRLTKKEIEELDRFLRSPYICH